VNDRPTAAELLEAVQKFLQDEAVPALSGHLQYQARVAANVVGIVGREIAFEDRHLRGEWERLRELLGGEEALPESREEAREKLLEQNRSLVGRIRGGEADAGPWRAALVQHLTQTANDKLEVAKGSRA
jgi:hypothetical protein